MKIDKFLNEQEIKWNELKYYDISFTHASYVNERKDLILDSYERLEYLGDSILGQVVSKYLFDNMDLNPGEMTLLRSNIVNKKSLSRISRDLEVNKYMNLGKGENRDKLSDSVFEDVFEAFIAAIYLDAGFDEAKKFIHKVVVPYINKFDMADLKDFKTKLQELLQSENKKSVTYKLVKQQRKDNLLHFTSEAIFNGQVLGRGTGLSKKSSEKAAAKDAYRRLSK